MNASFVQTKKRRWVKKKEKEKKRQAYNSSEL
jgi:hypothetical protein